MEQHETHEDGGLLEQSPIDSDGVAYTTDVHDHGESLLDGIIEITFGLEHVVAEFFWNAVFVIATFVLTKSVALRKTHKYIDSKHGITHEEGY